jgi:hypothetical protein
LSPLLDQEGWLVDMNRVDAQHRPVLVEYGAGDACPAAPGDVSVSLAHVRAGADALQPAISVQLTHPAIASCAPMLLSVLDWRAIDGDLRVKQIAPTGVGGIDMDGTFCGNEAGRFAILDGSLGGIVVPSDYWCAPNNADFAGEAATFPLRLGTTPCGPTTGCGAEPTP